MPIPLSKSSARRSGREWSARDLRRMRALARQGCSARQAAPRLGRTVGAVKFAAMTHGVRFHAIHQPEGTQRTRRQRATLSRLATRRYQQQRAS
jgi:hypothetical protein